MHSHYPLQSLHVSHCTRLHHLSTTSSLGHVAPSAGPETRGTGPDRDDSAICPRLDRAAIERAPAVSRGDHAPLAAGMAAAGCGRHHGATQGTAAGCGPAPRGHNRPAAVVAGTRAHGLPRNWLPRWARAFRSSSVPGRPVGTCRKWTPPFGAPKPACSTSRTRWP